MDALQTIGAAAVAAIVFAVAETLCGAIKRRRKPEPPAVEIYRIRGGGEGWFVRPN